MRGTKAFFTDALNHPALSWAPYEEVSSCALIADEKATYVAFTVSASNNISRPGYTSGPHQQTDTG
jgi:hypothetical protein